MIVVIIKCATRRWPAAAIPDSRAMSFRRGNPFFQAVSDLLRSADDRIVHAATSADLNELAHRRIFLHAEHAVANALKSRHFLKLAFAERLVHALPGKIEVERLRQKRQRIDFERQLFDLGPFVFGLGRGLGRYGIDEMRDLDLVRIAVKARHLRFELRVVALAGFDIGIDDENHLAPARAEQFAAAARSGLDNDRMALRRARHRERSARAEKVALIVEAVNLVRLGEQARGLVLNDGVVIPSVPVPEHDLHEFVGAVVAQIVADRRGAAHILRFAVIERGDDVPGGAAVRHQIERGEEAGNVVRLVIARRIGRAESKPLGRRAHHRQNRDGIELHAADAMLDGVGVIAPIHVRHRQAIVEETEVKLPLLQDAPDIPVIITRPAIGARSRMAPGAREIGAVLRLQKTDQNHLAHRRCPPLTLLPPSAWGDRRHQGIMRSPPRLSHAAERS